MLVLDTVAPANVRACIQQHTYKQGVLCGHTSPRIGNGPQSPAAEV